MATAPSEVIDGEVVRETGLATVEPQSLAPANLFGVSDPVLVVEKASKVAAALADVLNRQQLYTVIQKRKYVNVEGWTLLGSMLGVFAEIEWSRKLDDGGWEARAVARTLSGAVVGAGEGMCSRSESTWRSRDDYALRAMAQTRALSRALRGPLDFVVKLAGYGTTPAEEMIHEKEITPQAAVERPSERAEGSRGATTSPVPPATTSAAPPRPLAKNPVTLRRKPAETAEEQPPPTEAPTGEIPPSQASQETRRVLEEIAAHDRDNAPAGPLTWDSLLKWEREELVTLFGIINTRLTPPERWTPRKVTEYLAAGASVSDLSYELKQKIAALPVVRPAK